MKCVYQFITLDFSSGGGNTPSQTHISRYYLDLVSGGDGSALQGYHLPIDPFQVVDMNLQKSKSLSGKLLPAGYKLKLNLIVDGLLDPQNQR